MGWFGKLLAVAIGVACAAGWLSLLSWSSGDPSLNYVATGITRNFVGHPGAVVSDLLMQMIGLACIALFLPPAFWALHLLSGRRISGLKAKIIAVPVAILLVAAALSSLPTPATWPLRHGFGGMLGDMGLAMSVNLIGAALPIHAPLAAGAMCFVLGTLMLLASLGMSRADLVAVFVPSRSDVLFRAAQRNRFALWRRQPETHGSLYPGFSPAVDRSEAPLSSVPRTAPAAAPVEPYFESAARTQPTLAIDPVLPVPRDAPAPKLHEPALHAPAPRTPVRDVADPAPVLPPVEADDIDDPFDTTTGQIARRFAPDLGQGAEPAAPVAPIAVAPAPQQTYAPAPRRRASGYGRPSVNMLKRPPAVRSGPESSQSALRGTARLLEDVLADFGVKGEIKDIRPGPVVTLFELEPARGTKSSRVIGLADDIARSMSALSVRVAVVPGRNVIGIELPNVRRETVYLRELLESDAFCRSEAALPLTLGKTIGGDPIVTDLARMPHLLVAGTTGSGKSVGVNAMILSLLYRHTPDQCRFLMIDPKMLELSVYNGIPHLLTPVVTDPQKAVAALHWAVREMEERYKRMAKLSVRNIDVFNTRVLAARKSGKPLARTVQTGFDKRTGEAVYESETMDVEPMPHIVVVVDEFADLMVVAGKEIEGAVQRLAQMARAAGIHLIMATQRPSVDIITGTIKANFPTRISFKVTSKIDSRTILNEQGAEQLLGQGDMLFSGGAGPILRVHGPFVSDEEVESIADYLRSQGTPRYVEGVTDIPEEAEDYSAGLDGSDEEDLYDRAVAIVLRDQKASTSYIQRRLSIGYNRAADLIERMEREGIITPANHAGKRQILLNSRARDDAGA